MRLMVTAFTVFVGLDTFVLSSSYAVAEKADSSLFSELQEKADTATDTADAADTVEVLEASDTSGTSDAESNTTAKATKSRGPGKDGHGNRRGSGSSADDTEASAAVSESRVDTSTITAEGTELGSVTTDNYTITVTEYYENDTAIYVADVTVSSAEYLKTALADDVYGKNVTAYTSSIASSNEAVLAINGDYYGAQESGYVIRNGVIYRDTSDGDEVLVIYANGTMEVLDSDDYTAQELLEKGAWQVLSFGPGLVSDGEVTVGEGEEVAQAKTSNPRTAIGQVGENHYVLVVADGRTDESEGLGLYDLAQFMKELGCETAYNLDGGGSSTMYFNGEVINQPTTNGSIKERAVSDIVYIA